MRHKTFLFVLSFGLVVAMVVLASSLHDVRFEPGRSLGSAAPASTQLLLPNLQIPPEIPTWKILLFWLAAVINLILFFWLLTPDLRKRLMRQMLGLAVGVLAIVLALRYRILQIPQIDSEAVPAAAGIGGNAAAGADLPVFHPPPMSPWMVFLASFVAFLFVLLMFRAIYARWIGARPRRKSPLQEIAGIAQSSLHELAAGRNWSDVIIESYARMNAVVSSRRGLLRQASTTPREFADRLTVAGLPADAVDTLTRLFESARYGGHQGDPSDIKAALHCLNSIVAACGAVT
jgi:hypothetical protein